ncbi:hypothetical protein [Sphingomonas sp. ID0503]|uniref:hypothetical protein n=1 Tax=Sphingomonas sp. ID0503 TaxID=3399691 RepID=UPI003AFA31C6
MSSAPPPDPRTNWWETRPYAVALILASMIPLLWPAIPPIIDLPEHMGRYHIQMEIGRSPFLRQWYSFSWALMGNLGVDLAIEPMARLFGLELGVKLIVMAIPAMTVAGLLLIAREVHGRLPPTAAFALPLAYGFPFQFGFVNYALSMALALLAFGVWLRLGRQGWIRLRAAIFLPLGVLIWVCHTYGWGVLGLLAFAAEVIEAQKKHRNWLLALVYGGIACLPLAPPLLLMVMWRSGGVAGRTTDFLNWTAKRAWMLTVLRERSPTWDIAAATILYTLITVAAFRAGLTMKRTLGAAAIILLAAYLLIPRILIGSAYADMRLVAYMVAIAVIGISAERFDRRWMAGFAVAALAFYGARLTTTTLTFLNRDALYRDQLSAIDHIDRGARVFALVNLPCSGRWFLPRTEHIGAIATVRKDAFVNGQWVMPGAQLLRVTYDKPGRWGIDPSQVRRPGMCAGRKMRGKTLEEAVEAFPREDFDYLWLIDTPRWKWPVDDPELVQVWHGRRTGALYRINGSATTPSDTPKGSDRRATQ